MPKITIILTSYNHEKYIKEAIQSVLDQTYTDYELVIWDDASVDNSWDIIQSYNDHRIKAFRNDTSKRGIYGINKSIKNSESEYIAIHHSDDVWELNKLEKQVVFLDEHKEYGAVFTWAQIINENNVEIENNWFIKKNMSQWQWLYELFIGINHLNHPSILIRKKCYEKVGCYKMGTAQTGDAEMWSRLLIEYPIYIIEERLTKHRLFTDKSNASGMRPEVKVRLANEWNIIRENLLKISDDKSMFAVFPNLNHYNNSRGFNNKFLLAMACLYESKERNAWALGLRFLFELIQNPATAREIKECYDFDSIKLIKLTGTFDVYNINKHQDKQVARLFYKTEPNLADQFITLPLSEDTYTHKVIFDLIDVKNIKALWFEPFMGSCVIEIMKFAIIIDNEEISLIDSIDTNSCTSYKNIYSYHTNEPQITVCGLSKEILKRVNKVVIEFRLLNFGAEARDVCISQLSIEKKQLVERIDEMSLKNRLKRLIGTS